MTSTKSWKSSRRSSARSSSATSAESSSNLPTITCLGITSPLKQFSCKGRRPGVDSHFMVYGYATVRTKGRRAGVELICSLIAVGKVVATLRLRGLSAESVAKNALGTLVHWNPNSECLVGSQVKLLPKSEGIRQDVVAELFSQTANSVSPSPRTR